MEEKPDYCITYDQLCLFKIHLLEKKLLTGKNSPLTTLHMWPKKPFHQSVAEKITHCFMSGSRHALYNDVCRSPVASA